MLGINLIELATKAMLGLSPDPPAKNMFDIAHVGVKSSQFSYARLQGADPLHGVDMASTGEAACLGSTFADALIKSLESVGNPVPRKNIVISSGNSRQKADLLPACRMLHQAGYKIFATEGSWRYLYENGIKTIRTLWPSENANKVMLGTFPKILDLINSHEADMLINIPKNFSDKELAEGYKIRRAAIDSNIPLFTDARLASEFIRAFCSVPAGSLETAAWQDYLSNI